MFCAIATWFFKEMGPSLGDASTARKAWKLETFHTSELMPAESPWVKLEFIGSFLIKDQAMFLKGDFFVRIFSGDVDSALVTTCSFLLSFQDEG